jgi:hypothetical protein
LVFFLALQDVIRYSIEQETLERAASSEPSAYFLMDETTGWIKLQRSLLNSDINRFYVSTFENLELFIFLLF